MTRFHRMRESYEVGGRDVARRVAAVVLRPLGSVDPNVVTMLGCALNGVAAWLLFREQFLVAGIVFLIGSAFDAMDGAIAKITDKVTPFGAFLDSTLDRVSEGLVLGGLCLMFASRSDVQLAPIAACCIAIASSYLVSYTRAKAEALGVQCKGGLASRVERVVVLGAGIVLAAWWRDAVTWAVYVLAATAALTVVQRVLHVRRALRMQVSQ